MKLNRTSPLPGDERRNERVLVVADWRADARAVTAAVENRAAGHEAAFSVIVPAWLHGLDWIGDPTASGPCAHAHADELERMSADSGLPFVSVQVGDPDPVAAVEDALAEWPASEIMLLTRSSGNSSAVHPFSVARRIERLTGLPTRGVAIGSPRRRRQRFGWVRRGGRHCAVDVAEAA